MQILVVKSLLFLYDFIPKFKEEKILVKVWNIKLELSHVDRKMGLQTWRS